MDTSRTAVTVREARSGDVSAIRRVARRGRRTGYADLLQSATTERALDEWYDPASVREFVADDTVVSLVAVDRVRADDDGETSDRSSLPGGVGTDGDRVVGCANATGTTRGRRASLGAISVDPARWNEGIGSRLLSSVERRPTERGHARLRIRVLASNGSATGFYRAKGYERTGRREAELFGERVTELTLTGRIAGSEA